MPQYKAVTSVRCGKTFPPGQLIPDGILSDRDTEVLLKLGSIKEYDSGTPPTSHDAMDASLRVNPLGQASPPVSSSQSGVLNTPEAILDYVNSADEAKFLAIKGIGKTTAKAMVSHGAFASIKELAKLVPNVNWDSIQVTDNKV